MRVSEFHELTGMDVTDDPVGTGYSFPGKPSFSGMLNPFSRITESAIIHYMKVGEDSIRIVRKHIVFTNNLTNEQWVEEE